MKILMEMSISTLSRKFTQSQDLQNKDKLKKNEFEIK